MPQLTPMANIHALQKIFPAGFDNGYGSLKLLVDGFEVKANVASLKLGQTSNVS